MEVVGAFLPLEANLCHTDISPLYRRFLPRSVFEVPLLFILINVHYGFSKHVTSSSDVALSVISLSACLYVFQSAKLDTEPPSSLSLMTTQSVSASLAFLSTRSRNNVLSQVIVDQ